MNDTTKPRAPRAFPLSLERLGPVGKPAAAPAPPGATVLRPQRPLHQAVQDRARAAAPAGLGLDSEPVRQRMVQKLRAAGVRDEQVLAAMARVPRHLFVDTALATQAYEDTSLPIGLQQTISKPSVVARMLELLRGGRGEQPLPRILEIGTGCGYQAAVLALLGRQVISVERLKPLHEKARGLLRSMRVDNLRLVYGDGMLGHGPNAPYDGIVSAAGGDAIPQAWLDQLAVGGRLVAPVVRGSGQVIVLVERSESGFVRSEHEAVHFVPLKSGTT
ncbi:protein-L-isoaspartate(D-aspartate) O-methyltransferase [Aquabacterium sp. A7-Y]|uniref:protein-L-isoaspartate(D-aspartate) O-methyltransferase n=1 Tax=Aquabacterium sp. A7-Y TaxID=1349605 RepID=UPI00223E227E|nr:protein-L-isoaspartate(D-aspartate) O-methyltransferase [Aquabacterium sp. A7-Y]MCW7540769.1 protein-L-isoaspartate(D-aspartate) O-methyltransferase [Aquabacterium sp. A7-Y]